MLIHYLASRINYTISELNNISLSLEFKIFINLLSEKQSLRSKLSIRERIDTRKTRVSIHSRMDAYPRRIVCDSMLSDFLSDIIFPIQ